MLSLASLCLIVKYFFDTTHQFNKLKREYQNRKRAVEHTKEGVNKYTQDRSLSQSLKMKYGDLKKQNT